MGSIVRKLVNKIPRRMLEIPYILFYLITDWKVIKENYKLLQEGLKKISNGTAEQDAVFERSLKKYSFFMNRAGASEYLQSYFFSSDFYCLKRVLPGDISADDVILICCVKNDLTRIRYVYKHHKDIGVNNFVFVDNGSTDGTLEYLKQMNVDIYRTNDPYHAGAKAAWIRKVQDIYGYDRWYLILDSDELFSYVGMESHSIKDFIKHVEDRGIKRVWSILLDMYAETSWFEEDETESVDLEKRYRFFDTETYVTLKDYKGKIIHGGPRSRVIKRSDTPLSKLPLIFAEYEDIWADHTPVPFEKNFASDCFAVLRHYKFLPEDKKKFTEIAQNGNYAKESYEYKQYIKQYVSNPDTTFWYERSHTYADSMSLMDLHFLRSIFERDNFHLETERP